MRIFLAVMAFSFVLFGRETVFEANFDEYNVTAKGQQGQIFADWENPDLQLRMFPGAAGTLNALCLNAAERCSYPSEGFRKWEQGSLTLWLQLYNWDMGIKEKIVFFQANTGKNTLTILKTQTPWNLQIQLANKGQVRTLEILVHPEQWPSERWQRLDVFWTASQFGLLLNAQEQPATSAQIPALPVLFPGQLICNADVPRGINGSIAYDGIILRDVPLPPEKIKKEYQAQKALALKSEGRRDQQLVSIPRILASIEADGQLTDPLWQKATRVPLLIPFQSAGTRANAEVLLAWNGDHLLIGVEVPHPPTVGSAYTGRDSEVYLGDSVELHLLSPDETQYQFIFNPYGGIFDMRNGQQEWNCQVQTGVATTSNSWSVEALIPLTELGNPKAESSWKGNFCAAVRSPRLAYITWNEAKEGFGEKSGFGQIVWGKDESAVRLENISTLTEGRLSRTQMVSTGTHNLRIQGVHFNEKGIAETGAGSNTLVVDSIAENGECQFYYQWDLIIRNLAELTFRPRPDRQELEVQITLNNAGNSLAQRLHSEGIDGVLLLKGVNGHAYEQIALHLKEPRTSAAISMKSLRPGKVEIAFTPDDPALAFLKCSGHFSVPDMTPFSTRVGDNHEVPEPWHAIEVSGKRRYQVWNRTYEFAEGPFPTGITHGEDRILEKSPELNLVVAGKSVFWQWQDFRETEKLDDVLYLSGTGKGGDLVLEWKGELWFDGLYLFTFAIQPPANGRVEVERLELKWQMPAQFARYLLHPRYEKWDGEQIALPWNTSELSSTVILQGIEKGLAWWAQSDANWCNRENEKQISITRSGNNVEICAGVITYPVNLQKEARYTMSFMATPGRPAPKGWRTFSMMTQQPESFYLASTGSWSKSNNPDDILYATTHIPRDPEAFAISMQKSAGRAICYTLPGFLCSLDPEYSYFGPIWENNLAFRWPGKTKDTGISYEAVACCGDGITDLMSWRLQQLIEHAPGMGGLFYDIAHVSQCSNKLHGHGGIDQFGKHYSSSIALHLRKYLLRIYKILHKNNKILINHAHNNFHPMVHNFSDYWAPGEEFYYPLAKNPRHGYCEDISLEAYQSAWNVHARGVGILMLFQNTRIGTSHPDAKPLLGYLASEEAARRSFTPVLLHDFIPTGWWIDYRFAGKIQALRREIALDQAEFHGYWFDNAVRSESAGVYASYYTWKNSSPYRVVLVVGNISRDTLPASLILDNQRLNIEPEAVWTDLETGKELQKNFNLPGNHFRLIGIR